MFSKCFFKNLTVGCWNIEGIYEKVNSVKISKLTQPFFLEVLKGHAILCLQETHISQDEPIPKIEGYESTPHCLEISGNYRFFGGILIFIKNSIKNGIEIRLNFDEDALEVKLRKNFFGLRRDINFLFTYASPLNSPYTKAKPQHILEKIETRYISEEGNSIIMGDLNGRTKMEDDFVTDEYDKHSPINMPFYTKDDILKGRQNMDTHTPDEQGKMILGLCKSSTLRILNGRTPGDEEGCYTRYPSNSKDDPSTIDYALANVSLIEEIKSLSILPFTGLSDHCCISLSIKVNTRIEVPRLKNEKDVEPLTPNLNPVKLDNSRKLVFIKALKEDINVDVLRSILARADVGAKDVNNGISVINNILLGAAKRASFGRRGGNKKKTKYRHHTHEWYNKECKNRKRILRKCSKDLSISPFDNGRKQKFLKARTEYKKVCRRAEAKSRKQLVTKLMEIGQNDPKLFWRTIKKMNRWGKEQTDPSDGITPKRWIDYFQDLLNDTNTGLADFPRGFQTFEPILDKRISVNELREALQKLKGDKAPGPDWILGEYLKVFGQTFEDILLKLVNIIFSQQIYPTKWAENFLKPIFKKGSITDPDDYRGLAIGSVFAKLFSFILLKRLLDYIDIKKLISPEQIGFMKGKSTSDHIFLLRTIVEKVVKRNKKKLYAVFIDFKKAYDTVNRDLLIKKTPSLRY